MKKVDLGKIIMDIPPEKGVSVRNSDGCFYEKEDGEILFFYTRTPAGEIKNNFIDDDLPGSIIMLHSYDKGESFCDEETVIDGKSEGTDRAVGSMSVITMNNGDIGLFYLVVFNSNCLQMFLRRSSDGGKTWGERTLCTPYQGYFVVNNDRVTKLSNGRIIIPAARHHSKNPVLGGEEIIGDWAGDIMCFYSDDDGITWKESDNKCALPFTANISSGLQEPGIIELMPNVLKMWARCDLGRQFETHSITNGEKWFACEPSAFTAVCSPLSMKRSPSGDIYAIWNPIPLYNGYGEKACFTGGRTPLVIAVSHDNAKTFSEPVAFEWDDERGYTYCAICYLEDSMIISYSAGGREDGCHLSRLRIRKISYKELNEVL